MAQLTLLAVSPRVQPAMQVHAKRVLPAASDLDYGRFEARSSDQSRSVGVLCCAVSQLAKDAPTPRVHSAMKVYGRCVMVAAAHLTELDLHARGFSVEDFDFGQLRESLFSRSCEATSAVLTRTAHKDGARISRP